MVLHKTETITEDVGRRVPLSPMLLLYLSTDSVYTCLFHTADSHSLERYSESYETTRGAGEEAGREEARVPEIMVPCLEHMTSEYCSAHSSVSCGVIDVKS